MSELELADAPPASRIDWIAAGGPKVPVEVAASGPRVIAWPHCHADRVMFALGADEERIAWGIDVRPQGAAGGRAGSRTPSSSVPTSTAAAIPTVDAARNLVRGG